MAVGLHQRLVLAGAVVAGALTQSVQLQRNGWAEQGPVEAGFFFQLGQHVARCGGSGLDGGGEVGRIDQLLALNEQAARTTHHQIALDARGLDALHDGAGAGHEIGVDVRVGPTGVVGAHDGVGALHGVLHLRGLHDIGGHHGEVRLGGNFFGVASECHHVMTTVQQLFQQGRTHKTRCANQSYFHCKFLFSDGNRLRPANRVEHALKIKLLRIIR